MITQCQQQHAAAGEAAHVRRWRELHPHCISKRTSFFRGCNDGPADAAQASRSGRGMPSWLMQHKSAEALGAC